MYHSCHSCFSSTFKVKKVVAIRYRTNIVENMTSTTVTIIIVFDKCSTFQLNNIELFQCMHIIRFLYNSKNLTTVIFSKL